MEANINPTSNCLRRHRKLQGNHHWQMACVKAVACFQNSVKNFGLYQWPNPFCHRHMAMTAVAVVIVIAIVVVVAIIAVGITSTFLCAAVLRVEVANCESCGPTMNNDGIL
uniref:Transmembrane protein n=1 Tax=Craspedostauros australis TaxID=1486917 RepID=A0A7R9WML6_9STRA|mmetsp:Transcript_11970/g.32945  ORF Transcript_11970/g.32945 Transcript_11970/m.32945 type:complete len:111 (+) Transcript_11970:411-743(+)